jgi:hypothetical protein
MYIYFLFQSFFFHHITIIIELTKQPDNTYAIRRKKSDNAIIKPRLNRRIVKIEIGIQYEKLA